MVSESTHWLQTRRSDPPHAPGGVLAADITTSSDQSHNKTLFRLLYESAARSVEVLGLDVGNLVLEAKRGRVRRKGGATDWILWQSGTARLLPRLLAGRTRGPVFLTERRPGPARTPAAADLCPVTGRARLSYERAECLFKQATKSIDPTGVGYTLHQLRHSRLTHLGEDGWSSSMLMALSGHQNLRTLGIYVQPAPKPSRLPSPSTPPADEDVTDQAQHARVYLVAASLTTGLFRSRLTARRTPRMKVSRRLVAAVRTRPGKSPGGAPTAPGCPGDRIHALDAGTLVELTPAILSAANRHRARSDVSANIPSGQACRARVVRS